MMTTPKLINALLDTDTVRMRDANSVATKLEAMAAVGPQKFMAVSDFDFTLSRYHNSNGDKCYSTHGLFSQIAEDTDPEFAKQIHDLRQKYIQIEYCPEMKMEQKIPYMESWWKESHELIVQHKPTKELLRKAVKRTERIRLRDGCADFLWALNRAQVPLVLFSAGIGQIIEYVLRYQANHRQLEAEACGRSLLDNIHIISNFMLFDDDDVCTGFTDPLIHTFNKNRTVVQQEAPFFHKIADRTSVLLLGDSLGDIHMDVGIEKETVVLKIGYLNFDIDSLLDRYLDEYDIVLVDDQSMDVPNRILEHIGAHSSNTDQQQQMMMMAPIEKKMKQQECGGGTTTAADISNLMIQQEMN